MESNQNENMSETENIIKEADELLSTELDEEECVRIKKKSRRVSFADITSVHVFDRDEDFETPPDTKPNAGDNIVKTPPSGSPDSQPKDLQDKYIGQHLQLTPISSLQKEDSEVSDAQAATPVSMSDKGSPGEDREFFGPVSLWHIAPGMSGRSPVEDDITLDCTTFSLQFGKLMNPDKQCSNPGEGVKTPVLKTEARALITEDFKTPVEQTGQPSSDNTMALTKPKQARWWVVSDDKTLDNCEGMNGMSSSQEKHIKYEYENMSPYLESLLAEKLSEVQPGISFKELNQGKEHFVSSCSQPDSAFRNTGQGMKSKDSAGVEIKMSTIESKASTKQDDAMLTPDQERNPLTIENMSSKQNKSTGLTAAADSSVFDFDRGNLEHQQQSPRLLSPQWRLEHNNLVDKELDGCRIDIIATENSKDANVTSDVKIKQSIIETVGTKQENNLESMEGENCSSIKFDAEQQPKQTRKLSDTEVGMEPKKSIDLEMHGSTTDIMATKHCNDTGYMTMSEGNQSMIVTARLKTGNDTSLLNFETDQSQEKEKEIPAFNLRWGMGLKDPSDVEVETCNIDITATESNVIEGNQSMVEIAATKCEEGNDLRSSDNSHIHKWEEQQWQDKKSALVDLGCYTGKNHVNMDFEMSGSEIVAARHNNVTEATQDVEMNSCVQTIEAKKCHEDSKIKPAHELSLSSFDGKQQKQQGTLLVNPRPDTLQKDLAMIDELSATDSIATNHATLNTEAEIDQSKLEIMPAKHAPLSVSKFKGMQHEEQEERLSSLKLDVKLNNVDCVETERSTNYIMTFKDRNDTKLTPNLEMNQCNTKTVTMVGNFPCKFEGGYSQEEEKRMLLNLSQDIEVKDPVNVELETSAIDVIANKQNINTKLASGGELKGHLETHGSTIDTMATKHCNDTGYTTTLEGSQPMIVTARMKTGNWTSLLNFETDQSQEKEKQIAALNLRWGMGLKDPNDVEVETCNIDITETENNAIEGSQAMVEITETNCEEDNNLRSSDNSYIHKCEERQWQDKESTPVDLGCYIEKNHVNMDFEMSDSEIVAAKHNNVTEATQDVEMNSCVHSIEATQCHEDSKMKPACELSLSSFDGKQQKQQGKLLVNLRPDTIQTDLTMMEELSATDSIATNQAILDTDAEINPSILEIVPTKHAPLSVSKFKGMQYEEQQKKLLNLKLDVKLNDLDCVETERYTNCTLAFKERNDTKPTPNLEMNQCDTKTVTMVDSFPCKFKGGHSQEEEKRTLSNLSQGIEVKDPVNMELETSAIDIMANKKNIDTKLASGGELKCHLKMQRSNIDMMATKHCNDTGYTTTLEGNRSMIVTARLKTGNDTSLLNFEADQSQEKEKQIAAPKLRWASGLKDPSDAEVEASNIDIMATENNAIERSQSMVEIAALNCEADNTLKPLDNSHIHKCEEQQGQDKKSTLVDLGCYMEQNHINMGFEMSDTEIVAAKHNNVTEATQDVEMDSCVYSIEAEKCHEDSKMKSAYELSLSSFGGKQQKQQGKLLLNPRSDTMREDLAMIEELSATDSIATNHAILNTDAENNQSIIDIVPAKHAPLSNYNFKGMQHEKQQERLNLKLDVKLNDVDCVETESSTSCIMAFKERNDTMLTSNLEMKQFDTKTGTTVDNFPCKIEEGHSEEEKKRMLLNLAQDIEVKDPVNVELETSAIDVMANKQNIDTKLASDRELKQSLEIMVVKHDKDAQCTLSDCLSGLNYNGKDQMQQLTWKSELEMDPQRPFNMERESCSIRISTTHNNETKLTQKVETDHSMGITAAKDKEEAIFVPDVVKNQSLAQLHNKQVELAPPHCTVLFNPEEEHHRQKQQQLFISSKGFKIHGKSKLSEDQLINNFKEAGSIFKPIGTNITTPRNKQEQESFGSVEDIVSLDTCASLENEYLEGSVKHFPEPDGAEERNDTVFGKDFFRGFPLSNREAQQFCQQVDSAQIEVSGSVLSQPKMKHSIPRSELSLSKCNTVSDSSVTPLKKPTELVNACTYPLTFDENLEDNSSKDVKVSSTFSASVSKSLFTPMDSKECHEIPHNALSIPKDSSGNILEVNLRSSSQIIEPHFSVSGIDHRKSISWKNKLSKNQKSIHINTPLNKTTGLASNCSFPTQLISSDMKSKTVCELYDLKPNLSAVHKDTSLNTHHGLVSNSDCNLLSSVQPILSPIRGTMCEMAPLGPIDDCGSLTNAIKSNYSSVIRNDANGCGTSNNVFSTPVNLSNCGDANYSYSHLNSIEHLNLCGGSHQIDVQSSFQQSVRDRHSANPVSGEQKLTTSFMDTCASNTSLISNDFCSIPHSKGNLQGQRYKESFLQKKPASLNPVNANNFEHTDADFILRNAVDSVHQLQCAVKLNVECSSTNSQNGKESLGTQNTETHSNHGNVSLPLSEKECSSTQQNKLHWKSFAEKQLPNCTSGFISEGSMMLQNARGDCCLETLEFPCVTEKILSLQAPNDKGYLKKKRKIQEMDVQEQGSLIKDHSNSSLSFRIDPTGSSLSDNHKVYLENSEGRMPSSKRPFVTRIEPTEDAIAAKSRKLINVSDKFCQGVEELQIPLICKPKTPEECLSFLFLSQPQLCLFQETLKLIQEDMDRMKISNNQQFQALDVKTCSQMENKFLEKRQSLGALKWLQQVVAYEKSKLLLLQEKKHELIKKAQELHCGCQELDKLKSHYSQMAGRFGGSAKTAISRAEKESYVHFLEAEIGKQVENVSNRRMLMHGNLSKIEEENREASEKVIVMKQELEVLGNKIRDMCKFYCAFLKLKDDTNKEEITKMLKSHVEKRSLATLILKDIQLWNLKDIKSKPSNRFIELAYSNILHQRFVFEGDGPDANVLTCNRLDKKNVEKIFHLLNATEAFGFVLDLKQNLKIGGPGSISKVVAETSFLHCTLIDVLEEVQTCRMRLQNLSFAQFVCTTGQELHLQLIFIDCTVGLKARVMLDMSNLRCAVYPYDVIPLQIEIEPFERQSRALLTREEIYELTGALKPGYSRIKDLCGCISKLIESRR